jgi:aryl-alcohol dehydrogenase-like predicted oxidoreductase
MVRRRLGRTSLELSVIGFGAFKIGRNEGIKYAREYQLPNDDEVERLLNSVVDLGINYIDTAPAYGLSEERLGRLLPRSRDIVISTKVGETFVDGRSSFDFSTAGVRDSIERSREHLKRDVLDIVFVHSSGDDLRILHASEVVATLRSLREQGLVTAIGFSGKSVEGAIKALNWADALMVEYHLEDTTHGKVIEVAGQRGVGVVVKKGLASGQLNPHEAIPFVLQNPHVTSMVIGGLNLDHFRSNVRIADEIVIKH